MFAKKSVEPSDLDDVIAGLAFKLHNTDPETPEYAHMVDQFVKLYPLKDATAPKKMSADVKATILANLAGIVILVTHERAHVVTSKALGFIQKLR